MAQPSIHLIGNLSSGKSTIARLLAQSLNGRTLVDPDSIRNSTFDHHPHAHAMAREGMVRQQVAEIIQSPGPVIIESVGSGIMHDIIRTQLARKGGPIVTVYVCCPPDICLKRFTDRRLHVTLPFEWRSDPRTTIRDLHRKLEQMARIHTYPMVDTDIHQPDEIAHHIVQALQLQPSPLNL